MESPPTEIEVYERKQNEEHLRLLATFHTVVACIVGLFACMPLIHVGVGLMMMLNPDEMFKGAKGGPPPWFGLLFVVMGGVFVLSGWAMAVCTYVSGRYIVARKKRTFSFVVGAVLCTFMPFGTVLGIFTILILNRPSVQRLYEPA